MQLNCELDVGSAASAFDDGDQAEIQTRALQNENFAAILPRLACDVELIPLSRQFGSATTPRPTYKNYRLAYHKVVRALHYLVTHHAGYQNVTISEERLNLLRTDNLRTAPCRFQVPNNILQHCVYRYAAKGMPKNGSGGKSICLLGDDDVPDLCDDSDDELSDGCGVSSLRMSDVKVKAHL
jgi:hypothetical protein